MDLSPLDKLLREAREASDERAKPEETVEVAKRRALLRYRAEASAKKPRVLRRPFALVFAAALVVSLVVFFIFPRRQSITYVIGDSVENGALGAWIAAGPGSTELRFSEGTRLLLGPEGRARVTNVDEDGARLLLERGLMHARVVHVSASSSWDVHAGPFVVHVVGTEFDVAWEPTKEVLLLGMVSGKVLVRGPLLGEGRTLVAGEELRVNVKDQRSEVRVVPAAETEGPHAEGSTAPDTATAPASASASAPAPAPAPASASAPASVSASASASASKPAVGFSWRALAAEGRHREAMDAVEKEGFERVLASAPAEVLLELADEARFAGAFTRASSALVRARGLGSRGRSAFLLGKIAADHQNAPAVAVTWFEQYLAEEPSGGLAEQALGRVVELSRRLHDEAGASRAAERYLARYPKGAYAALARDIAGP